MVKLIAVDLDGTLLNEENQVSKGNLEAIKFAQSKGVEVVIATGRAHFDVQTIFKNIDMKTWIIGANGATIHQPNGELFHSVPINRPDALNILSWLEKEDYYYEVFSNHSILTPLHGRELLTIEMDRVKSANPKVSIDQLKYAAEKQFSQTGFSFINSYKDLLEADVDFYNILAFSFDEEKQRKGWANFEGMKDVTLVTSAKHNFELEHKNASKGIALEILANELKINLADTAAVGDSFNDLSMLRIAGRSAAMGNAQKEIKDCCQEVTLSNVEDGVAHFIYSLTHGTRQLAL
ncbi:Cof-type HAD-IIB family hydrolase [Neobacillus ginsengisoli]|uniref:Cof subfamily protein (Haloacid dehalogenase superfamily) n=1 Tax=Neobacillus ginsengisoli TaxID=904295 RepID=A0ABT9XUD9_9BACI|nr:Cof-type HAD-IIB family hydrolase [Neobacillus ginsengisoli]MDQ0199177.1 Cof subfamily protein (haloacid dehalogenase superfamily) [Neobacillus ginsengisoli]